MFYVTLEKHFRKVSGEKNPLNVWAVMVLLCPALDFNSFTDKTNDYSHTSEETALCGRQPDQNSRGRLITSLNLALVSNCGDGCDEVYGTWWRSTLKSNMSASSSSLLERRWLRIVTKHTSERRLKTDDVNDVGFFLVLPCSSLSFVWERFSLQCN